MSIYVDARYRFSLSENLSRNLKVGQMITEEEVLLLEEMDVEERAYRRVLRLISHRPRSSYEIRSYLDRHQVPEAGQARLLDRLSEESLVDDEAFARSWVEDRMYFRPRSSKMLRYELRQKGIHPDVIDLALVDFDESEAALRTAEKGARRWKRENKEDFQKRLNGYLQRRGFSYSDIQAAVDRVWLETAAGIDESEVDT
jgi:regulatory protein